MKMLSSAQQREVQRKVIAARTKAYDRARQIRAEREADEAQKKGDR